MLKKLFLTLFSLVVCMASAGAETIQGVGLMKLTVADPIGQAPMDAVVFFPSPDQTQSVDIGPYSINASRSAAIGKDRYPLILLSHGSGGSMWGHHGLASALARQGFIVVSVMHPGDNFQDSSRVGSISAIYGRPMQISSALTAALHAATIASHIDQDRIGFVGFSAGGTTGLILAGAKPQLSLLEAYCATRPEDRGVCEAKGQIEIDRPNLVPISDPRFSSFVLLAPLSVMFPAEETARIEAPVLIAVGNEDKELLPEPNAIALAERLPKARLQAVPKAGHFTFLSPCSAQLIKAAPALCIDNEGVDRAALHQDLNADITAFFQQTLGTFRP